MLIYNVIKLLDKEVENDMKARLKNLREAAHLTQKEAAEKIGVGQSAVSMWENGESVPRTETLIKIANVYNCEISDLFETQSA
jgi:transcriptional regulator with XRE-family HTH domain